ncbi:hypothetical protein [Chromobacterium amazonense]|uniref:Toxin n=1 Tax=Chromobacterium amazonense TaxID=1382803 RepID=A0ABU8V330_9NEIS|nr:hypothetical protein [Chromobacterium amazonense]MDE1713846.1 hypothetical protein [Chromobacterium amazonense]MDQ4541702.1 hypothetical protein [Chromobacterium amazonense]
MMEPLPKRIVIVGGSGAGKSTLAKLIGRALALPLVELDEWFWGPGWVRQEGFEARVAALAQGERWLAEGCYGAALRQLLPRADLVVWLDYPRGLMAWRIVRRSLRRVWRREALANGNRETLRGTLFSKDSLLLWAWRSHDKRRAELAALRDAHPLAQWHVLRGPDETTRWLRAFCLPV